MLLTQKEFIDRMLGKPWVDRASSFDSVDCWGLCLMYYRHVLGVYLPYVAGFVEGESVNDCWLSAESTNQWQQVDSPVESGLVFTCYRGDQPTHVGVTISPTHVLHCRGHINQPGKVEIHSIRALRSIHDKMTYHRFKG